MEVFSHLGTTHLSCKHKIDILSPYKVVVANVLENSVISICLELCFYRFCIHSPFSSVLVFPKS